MEKSLRKALSDYALAASFYLLINLVVFHGGIYRYLCKPESYAGNVYGRMQVLKEIEEKAGTKVIAFLGDSITEEGIDAKLFSEETNKPAVNLALPGTSPFDWFFFLRSIDAEQNRFESIVLTVIPQSVRTQAHDDGIQTLLPVANIPLMLEYLSSRKNSWRYREDYYGAFDRIFAFRRDLRELLLDPNRWFGQGESRNELLEKIRNYKGETFDVCKIEVRRPQGRVIRWGGIRDEEIKRLIRHNINRISKLNRKPEVAGLTGPIRIIAEMYKENLPVIVVSVPFGPGHHVSIESHAVQKYLNELQSLKEPLGVEHWTVFEEPFFHDCSNFFDYRHLNHKGRPIFTSWLSQQWLMITGKNPQ